MSRWKQFAGHLIWVPWNYYIRQVFTLNNVSLDWTSWLAIRCWRPAELSDLLRTALYTKRNLTITTKTVFISLWSITRYTILLTSSRKLGLRVLCTFWSFIWIILHISFIISSSCLKHSVFLYFKFMTVYK